MSAPLKVLILSASSGSGHIRAAAALEKVCRANPAIGEVVNVDSLTYTNKLFRQFYSKFYFQLMRNVPTLLGWFYDNLDEPWKTERMRLMLSRLNTLPLVRMIRKLQPDLTICTHFLPAEIISYLLAKDAIETRHAIVVTDLDVHAMWLSRHFHRYFVANEEARVHLQMAGLPPDRITVSGIPIDTIFSEAKDRTALCRKHALDPALPLVLVSLGGASEEVVTETVRALSFLKSHAQVVIIAGSHEAVRAQFQEEIGRLAPGPVRYRVLGNTSEMDEWLRMATLLIGKPGGLTLSEAMACGLPMVIYQPIPGQEERNSDQLLEAGAAVKCNHATTLAYKVDDLLSQPERLAELAASARQLGRPLAAYTVVETLLARVGDPPVEIPHQEDSE
ncbi:MAG: glycosyltransferase [Kiritimatiellae bacterium]|nr:glycosyltransferase [Kiritimatiellia bacterium]MCO5061161.1 glycosyltransferase [Kiritimatiellia bacterium]